MHRSLVACATGWLLFAFAWAAGAHPDADQDAIRLLIHRFAAGIQNGSPEEVGETLAGDGRFMGLDRGQYLASLARTPYASNVLLQYATFEPLEGGGVRISPIVARLDKGTFEVVWTAAAAKRGDQWKLTALELSGEFPAALEPKQLAELVRTTPVAFSIVDAKTRAPLHARVHIGDASGSYWPPRGHQKNIRVGWREDVGGDVRIDGKTWAYVPADFTADLPLGQHTVTVMKSMEFAPSSATISVGERAQHVVLAVERLRDMNGSGWYSGDTHVHFLDDHSALLEGRAEDLNVVNVLATRWGELVTNVGQVTGAPSPLSLPDTIVYFNEETRHGWIGHTILHGLKELVYPLSWGGPTEGVRGEFDYPPMAAQADKAHAQGGAVTWAHFPVPGGEVAVDVALGKVDSVDLFTWGDAFADPPSPTAGGIEVGPVSLWYRFLNTGFRLPATAGTDKMLNVQVAGSVRTYAHLDGKFTYERWLEAIRAGRTFVTTGPFVSLTANGQPIGASLALKRGQRVEIAADVQAPFDRYPVDTLEIVVGGEVVATTANDASRSELRLEHAFTAGKSTWIAARAHGSKLLAYQQWPLLGPTGQGVPAMAHTSPIYVSVDGAPIRSPADADALEASVDRAIAWAKNTARYRNGAERAEVLGLYEKAKRVYAGM
jgi:hypothetical protein